MKSGSRESSIRVMRRSVATPFDAARTVLACTLAAVIVVPAARWAIVDATWRGNATVCRGNADGACWSFIGHKLPFILFGLFPADQRWRGALATGILLGLVVASCVPRFWHRRLMVWWPAGLCVAYWLMRGGAGIVSVPVRLWGGLPLTLMLTVVGLGAGFPLAIGLALARTSRDRVLRIFATAFVEVIRGVPLIAVLYVAALIVPLAMPRGVEFDKLVLASAAVAVFASAYLAEAVRAGLQMIPAGQREAALSLGLTRWQASRRVVLPQALRVVIPAFVSIAVGFFQDTSLVVIIGLFDLLHTARVAAQDSAWLGFHAVGLVFVAMLYFGGSAALSRYGLWLETRVGGGRGLPASTRGRPLVQLQAAIR